MRKPQKTLKRQQASIIRSIPSPVGGLNARDPIAQMDSADAVKLDNFFCTPYDVIVRYGYSNQSTGLPSTVDTLASYAPSSSVASSLFAFSSDKVYNATTPGAIGAPVISGNVTSRFQTVTFGTAAGIFLVSVSGSDLPLVYNGSVWSNIFSAAFNTAVTSVTSVGTVGTCIMANPHNVKTGMSFTLAGFTPAGYNGTYVITVTSTTTFTFTLSGALGVVTITGTAAPVINAAITGVDPASLIQVTAFKSRLWAIEKNSCKAWYLPVISIGGAAASVDLSSLFSRGGFLSSMSNWSLDAGQGMDDYIAFISSRGQVAVYKGTDPASAATFSLVGIFDIGAPIGRRCFTKFAGDVLVITQDGLVPLSAALMSTRVNTKIALTDKVQNLIGNYITNYGSLYGWETILFPKENMLLLNIPTSSTTAIQFVMNTISMQWSTFSGWNAVCWVLHDDRIYFGGNTVIGKAWDTYADIGTGINFDGQQSFNYFGGSGQLKQVKMARPVIATDGSPAILFGINVDFDTTAPTGIPSFTASTSAVWDTAVWDSDTWGGEPVVKKDWQSVSGIGYCISAHMVGQVLGSRVRWSSTDFMLQGGGMI